MGARARREEPLPAVPLLAEGVEGDGVVFVAGDVEGHQGGRRSGRRRQRRQEPSRRVDGGIGVQGLVARAPRQGHVEHHLLPAVEPRRRQLQLVVTALLLRGMGPPPFLVVGADADADSSGGSGARRRRQQGRRRRLEVLAFFSAVRHDGALRRREGQVRQLVAELARIFAREPSARVALQKSRQRPDRREAVPGALDAQLHQVVRFVLQRQVLRPRPGPPRWQARMPTTTASAGTPLLVRHGVEVHPLLRLDRQRRRRRHRLRRHSPLTWWTTGTERRTRG
mmetsp:Transcript_22038/g.70945  ORF Transcript_22038/g.70945 Transcript_22038/m.70945 type:complete len:282 (+) Transcript_22038:240-1085(+)